MGHFNDFDAANQVTAKGRELIQSAVAWLKDNEAKIIEVDTDGIYFMPPETVQTEAEEESLIADLEAILPEGIELELDGRYPAMFSYKMKNYALLDEQGRLLHQRLRPAFARLRIVSARMAGRDVDFAPQGMKEKKFQSSIIVIVDDIEKHRRAISWLAKTETLQDSLETYQTKVKTKKRNAARSLRTGIEIPAAPSAWRPDLLLRDRNKSQGENQRELQARGRVGCGKTGRERRTLQGEVQRAVRKVQAVDRVSKIRSKTDALSAGPAQFSLFAPES